MIEPRAVSPNPAERRKPRQYQSFDGVVGGSSSDEKLARLRLNLLGPLRGKSVLDLGCNEGFFCGAMLAKGASRVVGVERSAAIVAKARERFPKAEFKIGSWWDAIPNEQFDVILFLSAIHYEPDQKALLDKLNRHLKPDGVLVLECGLASPPHDVSGWLQINRPRDTVPRRYPSLDYLRRHIMPQYVLTGVGASVPQKGDPVPRWVLHCRKRKPIALILGGQSGAGKSHFGVEFGGRDIPVYRTDALFRRLLSNSYYDHVPLAIALRETGERSCSVLSMRVAANEDLTEKFCAIILGEGPLEAPGCILEGEAFSHPQIMQKITELLTARGVLVWGATRATVSETSEQKGRAGSEEQPG
jgi:SAM-dependent methyltransferase